MFDHSTNIYTIVGEIKCDDSPAEQQNIEQMLGVWRKNQRAMLGFTCNKEFVHLRVLLGEENYLRLYRLVMVMVVASVGQVGNWTQLSLTTLSQLGVRSELLYV